MPIAELSIIKRYDEFRLKDDRKHIPKNTRGIYVLLNKEGDAFNVVYMGMAGAEKAGIHGRLNSHSRNKLKTGKWSHFSIFEVHDNITRETIQELEGLFRHIYSRDSLSQKINLQKRFKKFKKVHHDISKWKLEAG
jgi:hypothetical protein